MPPEIIPSIEAALKAIEPEAAERYRKGSAHMGEAAQISTAISLKRIADAIDGDGKRMGIADAIANLVRANP